MAFFTFIKSALSNGNEPSSTRLNVAVIVWSIIGIFDIGMLAVIGVWIRWQIKQPLTTPITAPPLAFLSAGLIGLILLGAMGIKGMENVTQAKVEASNEKT